MTTHYFSTGNFFNGYHGTGITNITRGGQFNSIFETYNANLENSNGTINILGKSDSQIASTYKTNVFYNGHNGTAKTKIADGGQLIVDSLFSQNAISTLELKITNDYLQTQTPTNNLWAITGNDNTGITNISLDGLLSIVFDAGVGLADNQIYNLIQLLGNTPDNLEGIFLNLQQGDLITTHNDIDIHISYQGGDGNDIILYTDIAPIQGDVNGDGQINQQDLDLTKTILRNKLNTRRRKPRRKN